MCSSGAWSRGPPGWVTSQVLISEDILEVQHNTESQRAVSSQSPTTNIHDRTSSGFDGKDREARAGFGEKDREARPGFDGEDLEARAGFDGKDLKARAGFDGKGREDRVGFDGKDREVRPQRKRVAERRDTSPWYPGKVNRNRNRERREIIGDGKSVEQSMRTTSSASSSRKTTLTSSGGISDITVANVHKKDLNKQGYKDLVEWVNQPNHLYIGRDMTRFVPGAVHSKWHNPFKSKQMGREKSCAQFREYILTDKTIQSNGKTLFESLNELKGKTLGCWCHPDMCHGHVLRELVKEFCP